MGEDRQSIVEVDCERLRSAFSVTNKAMDELAIIIQKNSHVRVDPCEINKHFFEVVMDGILESGDCFLDWKAVEEYLSQTAPVPFDAQRFVYATKISERARENNIEIRTVNLVIETPEMQRQVFKPYKTHYKTERENYDIHITDVCFFPESDPQNVGFWVWYGKSDLLGMIGDKCSAGLRLRKNNIALGGSERVSELFAQVAESNRRFNGWLIGEIHIIYPLVIPNARRDGVEETPEWVRIKQELLPFVKARCQEIRVTSEARNAPVPKLVTKATQIYQRARTSLETGLVPEPERLDMLDRIRKEEARISQAVEAKKGADNVGPLIEMGNKLAQVRKELENKQACYRRLSSQLSKRERKIITKILGILHRLLSDEDYNRVREAILEEFTEPETSRR